jgi:F-type H+-transporting ATPase subunit epsilon
MPPPLIKLEILLPSQVFAAKTGVSRIIAETHEGSFGIWPHRLDCVVALTPGILIYEIDAQGDVYVAIDEGVLVKTGFEVLVSVRRATSGTDLAELRELVEREYRILNEDEQRLRLIMARVETAFIRHFASLRHA